MNNAPTAIILAAGRGRRFAAAGGKPFKQTQPLFGAPSVVEYVCRLYADCDLPVACALHPELKEIAARLAEAGHQVVPVTDADAGMGHSLSAAITAAPSETGWLIALADMPKIRPATIRVVANALMAGAALCAPFHEGRRGHPVGFDAGFGPALRGLTGDEGARALLRANADTLRQIDVEDPGVLFDINVPGELLGLAAR